MLAVYEYLTRLSYEQIGVVHKADNGRRVRVHDHLSKRIVLTDLFRSVRGKVFEQPEHRRYPPRMNPILGLFEAQQAVGACVHFEDRQGKEAERAVRKGSSRMKSSAAVHNLQRQQLPTVVDVNVDGVNIFDKLR